MVNTNSASAPGADRKRIFICYSREQHADLAERIYSILKRQKGVDVYVENHDHQLRGWEERVRSRLRETDLFIYLVFGNLGKGQYREATIFHEICDAHDWKFKEMAIVGKLVINNQHPPIEPACYRPEEVRVEEIRGTGYRDALQFAQAVMEGLGLPIDPSACPDVSRWYSYEKTIIDTVLGHPDSDGNKNQPESPEVLCWPEVEKLHCGGASYPNPLTDIGALRTNGRVLVDARSIYHTLGTQSALDLQGPDAEKRAPARSCCLARDGLTFVEAGPRAELFMPVNWQTGCGVLNVAIVVSGGIAPGINAVISGIIQRHLLYHRSAHEPVARHRNAPKYQLRLYGYRNGFSGMKNPNSQVTLYSSDGLKLFNAERVNEEAKRFADDPGSRIGTSRFDPLLGSDDPSERERELNLLVDRLFNAQIHILYVVGGEGSMRGAHAIWELAQSRNYPLSVVAVPKTMDNDILWVWQSFGFLSATEKAREVLRQLHVEVASNPRLGICQLFGSDSGFVVSHAALASGVCDLALIPEVDFSLERVLPYIQERLDSRLARAQSPYALVAIAETAIPVDARSHPAFHELAPDEKSAIEEFFAKGRRIEGQTPDILRHAGLNLFRIAAERHVGRDDGPYAQFRTLANEPRHLLRTTEPSVTDVIFGQRLGILAVDSAMAGFTDFMISQWMTEYVIVPLQLVTLGRKRVPPNGIFWKSVVAATGQPATLV